MRHVTGLCLVSLLLSGCGGGDAFRRDIADSFRRIADAVEQEIRNPGGTTPPPVNPIPPNSVEIEAELGNLLLQSNSTISIFGGDGSAHCLALSCMETDNIYVGDYTPTTMDISGFVFTGTRRGVSLAEKVSQTQNPGPLTETYHHLAGWMEHNFFHIEAIPQSGAAWFNYYDVLSVGDATGTNPAAPATGSATWSGTMAGVVGLAGHDGAFVDGDASVTFPGLHGDISPTVDVLFSNIVHRSTGGSLANMSWNGVDMTDGAFGSPSVIAPVVPSDTDIRGKAISEGIYGRFYGTGHEEVGGVFRYDDIYEFPSVTFTGTGAVPSVIVGAFGAKRDE